MMTPISCKPLSVWRKVLGFLASGVRVARSMANGEPTFVPICAREARRAVCRRCPCRSNAHCDVCGCFYEPKTLFTSEQCPKGFWT